MPEAPSFVVDKYGPWVCLLCGGKFEKPGKHGDCPSGRSMPPAKEHQS